MSRIYRMGDAGLTVLTAEDFKEEQELEALIARYPELLDDEDQRYALVRRQQGIAEVDEAPDRWAVDLLLVDHDAVPTLVEVKRGSSSDLRRRVVGQMLDYASHARHVSVERLRESFEESARSAGRDPDSVLTELLGDGDGAHAEGFWERVSTNLRGTRLRLLFAADTIPDELARVVAFLNEQMQNIEVLAVEIRRFRAGESQTLVPTVIGKSAGSPGKGASRGWTRATFPDAFSEPAHRDAARRLLDVAASAGGSALGYGSGISIRARVPGQDTRLTVAWLLAPGRQSTWQPVREFSFGAGNANNPEFFNELPGDLSASLRRWADQFASDTFAYKDPRSWLLTAGVEAWCVSYDDAAQHIDTLAARLERVLVELRDL